MSCQKAIWPFSSNHKSSTLTSFQLQSEHLQLWPTSSQSEKVLFLSCLLTLSQITALWEGKCQAEVNGWLRSDLWAIFPCTNGETWTAGVITQPFLKEENDNNHRRACHGKQPRGCVCEPVNLLLLRGISWVWFKGRPAPCHVSCESESGWELEAGLSLRVYLTRTWLPRETCQGPGVPGESPMDLSWLWFLFSSSVPLVSQRWDHPPLPPVCTRSLPFLLPLYFLHQHVYKALRWRYPCSFWKGRKSGLGKALDHRASESWVWLKVQTQQHVKRCSSSLIIREIPIETVIRYHLKADRMTSIKKNTNSKCWRGCGEKGTLVHC